MKKKNVTKKSLEVTHIEDPQESIRVEDKNRPRLGPYILVKKLGEGGMGVVYKVYHPGLDKTFALKTLKLTSDKKLIQRFIREGKLAAKLKHQNIVQVHKIEKENGRHYIVMDYIKGKNLGYIIKTQRLSLDFSLKVIVQIARALDLAHKKGIIHRDIKPSNIIIEDCEKAYLMDFGLASSVFGIEDRITCSGDVIGTPQYMSPEQARGKNHEMDCRSDIYSLGAVLYEMLAGTPVINSEDALEILFSVVNKDPIPLAMKCRGINRDIEAITMKCLEKSPENRYQNARELIKDIERYSRGRSILASPVDGLPYLVKKWVNKHKGISVTAGLAFLIILGISLLFIFKFQSISKELEHKDNIDEKNKYSHEAPADNTRVSRVDPKDIDFYFQRGILYAKTGRFREGLKDYNQVIEMDPENALAYHNRGHLYLSMRDLSSAIMDYTAAIKLNPTSFMAYRDRGQIYHKMLNEYAKALKDYTASIQINPHYSDAYMDRAILYESLGNSNQAFEDYNRVIQIDPGNAEAYNKRGKIFLYTARQSEKAMADYNMAIKLNPRLASAYDNRGFLYQKLGQFSEALSDYSQSIAVDPSYSQAYNDRGVFYMNIGKASESMNDYNMAISLNPNDAYVYINRGSLYQFMKQPTLAMKDYNTAVRLGQGFWQAYAGRGTLYFELGQYKNAVDDLEQSIKLGGSESVISDTLNSAKKALENNK